MITDLSRRKFIKGASLVTLSASALLSLPTVIKEAESQMPVRSAWHTFYDLKKDKIMIALDVRNQNGWYRIFEYLPHNATENQFNEIKSKMVNTMMEKLG